MKLNLNIVFNLYCQYTIHLYYYVISFGLHKTLFMEMDQVSTNKVGLLKVQLTPNLFFRLFKFPYFSDRHCKKIIVVAFFVNFL